MDYVIAIPTHKRSEIIFKKTLKLISETFDSNNPITVYLFLSNVEESRDYEQNINNFVHNFPHIEIIPVVCNTKTATEKFNFIQSFFTPGQNVFVIEDDVSGLVSKKEGGLNIKTLAKRGFDALRANNLFLFGVYPSSNKFFMSNTFSIGLCYIVANIFGFVQQQQPEKLLCKLPSKTDYERSLLYFKHCGGSIRFNDVAARTNNYSTKGGMQEVGEEQRATMEKNASLRLAETYSPYIKINTARKSKYLELSLINKQYVGVYPIDNNS